MRIGFDRLYGYLRVGMIVLGSVMIVLGVVMAVLWPIIVSYLAIILHTDVTEGYNVRIGLDRLYSCLRIGYGLLNALLEPNRVGQR